MSESTAVRVLVADDNLDEREVLVQLLETLGHLVVAQVGTGREAVTFTGAERPDAVLLDVNMPDGNGIDAAKEISVALPCTAVVLITGDEELSLTDDDLASTAAISLLGKPVKRQSLDASLRGAVRKARELCEARKAVLDAEQKLEGRKKIERAKGILMRRTGCTEAEAYRILQRTSQDKSISMVAVAQAILDSEDRRP